MKIPMSERLALEARVNLTANLELQLREGHQDNAPLLRLLQLANAASASAISQMAEVSADDASTIRKLQTDIRVFDRIVEMLRDTVQQGAEASEILSLERREEVVDMIGLDDEFESDETLAGEQ